MWFKFYLKKIYFIGLIVVFSASCRKENTLERDIANINTEVKIERFDKLFSQFADKDLKKLQSAYPFMFSMKYPDSFWIAKKGTHFRCSFLLR